MNTAAHIAAFVALLWFSLYAFNTLSVAPLGFALMTLAFTFIPLTILAALDDWEIIQGRREE